MIKPTNKKFKLEDYSNPKEVYKKAKVLLGDDVIIKPSTRKNKKYMVLNPNNNKWVHFGQLNPPYEDYTKHKNNERREQFKNRNKRFLNYDVYSPAYLSYKLLW